MTILEDYFDQKLVEAGFPRGLDIEYSLSYSQGDGMAFYGDLALDDFVCLFNKMNTETSDKIRRRFQFLAGYMVDNEDVSISIIRNHWGLRYSHWNSMTLEYPSGEYLKLSDIRSKDRPILRNLWHTFTQQLKEYIQDTSRELESLGYRIIDSTYIDSDERTEVINTKNYRIKFTVEPVPFFDGYFNSEDFGYENVNDFCEAVINGMKVVDLRATVYQKELAIQMGESTLGWCAYDNGDKTYGNNKRYLIQDAINDARAFAQLAVKTVQHLRPLAIN